MRNRRVRGGTSLPGHPVQGPAQAGVPGLRFGRYLGPSGRASSTCCTPWATWTSWRPSSTGSAAATATWASRTRAGPLTAGPPTRTPTRTRTAPAGSPSCSTASWRTTSAFASELQAEGHEFTSETDAEVVAHLIERLLRGLAPGGRGPRPSGRWRGISPSAPWLSDEPDVMVAVRKDTPLVVGRGRWARTSWPRPCPPSFPRPAR